MLFTERASLPSFCLGIVSIPLPFPRSVGQPCGAELFLHIPCYTWELATPQLCLFLIGFLSFLQLLRELIERKTTSLDPNDQVAMGRWVGWLGHPCLQPPKWPGPFQSSWVQRAEHWVHLEKGILTLVRKLILSDRVMGHPVWLLSCLCVILWRYFPIGRVCCRCFWLSVPQKLAAHWWNLALSLY